MNVPTAGTRDAIGAVHDVDEEKHQVHVVIPWERLDTYRTDFSRDCFDGFLSQRLPAMAWCHQKTEPIGHAISHQKGQRANEFTMVFSDLEAVPRAKQAFVQMRDGDLTDVSFTFTDAKHARHPSERGAIRFTEAKMPEISPVIMGSIPGATVTGVRSAADSAGNLSELINAGVISPDEARQMLGLDPLEDGQREAITITPATGDAFVDQLADAIVLAKKRSKGQRDDAAPAAEPAPLAEDAPVTTPEVAEIDTNVLELAGAVDAALEQGIAKLEGVDVTALEPDVQEALAAFTAGSVASNAMLDSLGVPALVGADGDGGRSATEDDKGDEPAAGERAAVSDKDWPISPSEYSDSQWSSACLITGPTRDDCKLPVKDPDGTVNKQGVISASKMIGHVKGVSDDDLKAAAKKLMSLLGSIGEKATPSVLAIAAGKRDAMVEDEIVEDEAAILLALGEIEAV